MEQVEIREGARRQHRSLAMFCALYCWHHNKQATFIEKMMLLNYLGLKRFRGKRFEWVVEDSSPYFPYVFQRDVSRRNYVVFSKLPKSELAEKHSSAMIHFKPSVLNLSGYNRWLFDPERNNAASLMDESLPYLAEIGNLHEFSISNSLSLMAHGVISPTSVLAIKA